MIALNPSNLGPLAEFWIDSTEGKFRLRTPLQSALAASLRIWMLLFLVQWSRCRERFIPHIGTYCDRSPQVSERGELVE